jgi:hypothetical protein
MTKQVGDRDRQIAELQESIRAKDAELDQARADVDGLRGEKANLESVLSTTLRDKAKMKDSAPKKK